MENGKILMMILTSLLKRLINGIKKDGNDSGYDEFSDSNDYTSEEFIKSNKTNFLDIFRSIYNSFRSFI